MIRKCDGTDEFLKREQVAMVAGQESVSWVPCDCGLEFDDVVRLTIYPHRFIPLQVAVRVAIQAEMERMIAAGMTAEQISNQLTSQPVSGIVESSATTKEGSSMDEQFGTGPTGEQGDDTAVVSAEDTEAAQGADDAVDSVPEAEAAEQNPGH